MLKPNVTAPLPQGVRQVGHALVSSDYDDSLGKHLPSVNQLSQCHNPPFLFHINTARGLTGLKALAKKIPFSVDYVSGLYGTLLFKKPHALPTPEWLKNLTATQQLAEWTHYLHQHFGWHNDTVIATIQSVLNQTFQSASQPSPRNTDLITVHKRPDQSPDFQLTAIDDAVLHQVDTQLTHQINTALAKQGISSQVIDERKKNIGTRVRKRYVVVPSGINKLSPLRFLLARHNPRLLITVGDSPQGDGPMLLPDRINQHTNHRIVCGENPELKQQLPPSATVVWVDDTCHKQLGQSIKHYLTQPTTATQKT